MTVLSAAFHKDLLRLELPARLRAMSVVEPHRLLGLTVLHLWRFMLVLGLAAAVFGAGGVHAAGQTGAQTGAQTTAMTQDRSAPGAVSGAGGGLA